MFQTTVGPEEQVRWLQLLSGTYLIHSRPGRKEGSPSPNLHSLQPAQRMGGGCEYSALPEDGKYERYCHCQVNQTNTQKTN